MPAQSESQRRLMMMALHNPSKVHKKNRGVLKMSKSELRKFAHIEGGSEYPIQHRKGTTITTPKIAGYNG